MELKLEHISKRFKDKTAVDDVSLTLTTGVWGLLGANGAGKTTLMRMIADIMKPSNGSISFNGEDIRKMGADYRNIFGFLPQDFGYSRDFTVKDYLEYVAALKDVPPRETTKKINHLLDILTLSDVKGKKIAKLSGGMKRRVGIAQAMLNDPKILVMDEPTAAVDPQSRNKILEGIQKLNEQGSTIIYTSHYMEEVEQICTRIAIMDHGHVIASGTKEDLKKMIKTGETITIEAIPLTSENLADIRTLPHVFDLHYEEQILTVRCTGARHNLIRLLNYLQSQDISFGQVSSELPTLNDVFLEITGKQLRD